ERFDPAQAARRFGAWLEHPPGGTRGRILRGLVLVGAGAFALLRPATALSLAIVLGGGLVAFAGLRELFEVVLPAAIPADSDSASESVRAAGLRAGIVLALAALLIAGIAWFGRPRAAVARVESGACNGAPELCGRRLDEVVFPGTHNSMSAA